MRKAVQITGAAIIAAVLMTGCGSESKKGDGDKPAQATPPADAPKAPSQAPAEAPAASGGDVTAAKLAGGWKKGKLEDNSFLVLSFAGRTAMLSGAGQSCTGMVNDSAKPVTLAFKCKEGAQYASGTVKRADAASLTVAWASGTEDTFKKAVGVDGKPAAGLPGKLG
ncbi:hypothetical protein AF335_22155 [Streptomyces eurocidicus]|uniref:Lipoprotein n=1 Tax=Streptomyces eurocidicus TaxID=66423 RepID=A0A2N8NS49_STREU|nr:hypothetical protein [Streptomyces eurocidicus]MBB5122833.1 hypothetical protein [Streptomyces eurocidicus]MBF6054291.1 hypothetical protein [Streptomyces eurocidicus]PNE31582.1 hypothetical protein AF335_22155 [Streptomyces eurocidicus]